MRAYESSGKNEKKLVRALVRDGLRDEAERVLEIMHFFPGTTLVDTPAVKDVPHARSDDLPTSRISGLMTEQIEGTTSVLKPHTTKHYALRLIAERPRTAIEAERDSGHRGLWKRVSDLKNAELIEGIGERVDPETKRPGVVWKITASGQAVLDQLDANREVRL